jgi:hypothetical protein
MKILSRMCALLLTGLVLVGLLPSPAFGQGPNPDGKKVIILIADYTGTNDLINSHTPNLDALLTKSGSGLMNIRAKNKYPSSSYMSLATGARVGTIENAGISYNSTEKVYSLPGLMENSPSSIPNAAHLFSLFTAAPPPDHGIVNLYIEPARRYAANYNPSYQVGSMGMEARELGYRVAVLGNSDTILTTNRNAVILGMDERGIVPQGNISRELLEVKPTSPGGVQSDHNKIISNLQLLLPYTDILIIDMGDTSRVELNRENTSDSIVLGQRQQAIERNDLLLGRIMNSIDMEKTMLVILSPNPNKEMQAAGNFGLTPAIIYTPDTKPGLLISATTRRPGLVTNIDLKPTVFSYLENNYPVSGISTIESDDNSLEKLDQQANLFTQLRKSRNPLHYLFMFFALLGTAVGALVFIGGRKDFLRHVNYTVYCALSMPLIFLFISFTQYFSLAGVLIISFISALLIAALVQFLFKDPLDALLFLTLTTAILLTFDSFTGSRLMLVSPLGSDAIAGGRFYGIGNDYMGILLACTVISTLLVLDKLKHLSIKPLHQALIGLLPLTLVAIAIGHPRFGTNMGGFITAVVTIGFFFIIVGGRKISFSKIILILFLAVLAVFGVAQLDAILNPTPSHAGKAISSLHSGGGFMVLLAMIKTKLGILASTVYNSTWSLILLLIVSTLVVLKRKSPHLLLQLAVHDRAVSQAAQLLLAAAITVFVVNDTGVIAAAFIVLYLLGSLWLTMSRSIHQGRW